MSSAHYGNTLHKIDIGTAIANIHAGLQKTDRINLKTNKSLTAQEQASQSDHNSETRKRQNSAQRLQL